MPGTSTNRIPRRQFLAATLAAGAAAAAGLAGQSPAPKKKALIAITLDLEMSREYPVRGMTEWDYQKGNLDDATKQYSLAAGRVARELGGVIHYFCVGRTLEQPNVDWLKALIDLGHPIGNHTYDHVNVLAAKPEEIQYRFQRSPWLLRGRQPADVIRENIEQTTEAMRQRLGIAPNGFRTPGGFANGLAGREDLQDMLRRLGFQWASAKYPAHQAGTPRQEPAAAVYDDIVRAQQESQPFAYPGGLVEVPMSPISDVNAFRTHFWKLDWFLTAVRRGVEWAIQTGGVYDFLAHPSCLVVEDPQFETVKLICRLVKEAGDRAEIVGLDRMAERATASR